MVVRQRKHDIRSYGLFPEFLLQPSLREKQELVQATKMLESKYRAFVSYSQHDKRWAKKLHRELESYKVPLGVVADIDPSSRKIGRVFRDDDEMGANEDLGTALEQALAASECLIVLCSPNSARSKWVDLEVRRFKRNSDARVFAVIVEGVPNSGDPITECFCPSLRFKVTVEGELTDTPEEPLAPDWRKEGLHRLTTRLTAGILNVPFDNLWQRETRRRKTRNRILAVAALSVGVIVSGYAVKSTRANNLEEVRQLTIFSFTALEDSVSPTLPDDRGSNAERALRLAVLAARQDWLHPFYPEVTNVLYDASSFSRGIGRLVGHEGPVRAAAFMENDTHIITAGVDQTIKVWDLQSLDIVSSEDVFGIVLSFSSDGMSMNIMSDTGEVWLRQTNQENTAVSLEGHQGKVVWSRFNEAGSRLVTCDETGTLFIWNVETGENLFTLKRENRKFYAAFFGQDAPELITADQGRITVWSLTDPITEKAELPFYGGRLASASVNSQGVTTALTDNTNNISVSSLGAGGFGMPPSSLLRGHQAPITSVTIANGVVTSSSMDGTARIWMQMFANEIMRLQGHEGGVLSVTVNKTLDTVVTTSADGTARLWDMRSREGEEWQEMDTDIVTKLTKICNPQTGQLRGASRFITSGDIVAAPILKSREGLDVCARYVRGNNRGINLGG